jgi:hypothetical protein
LLRVLRRGLTTAKSSSSRAAPTHAPAVDVGATDTAIVDDDVVEMRIVAAWRRLLQRTLPSASFPDRLASVMQRSVLRGARRRAEW